ncbi:hypothetical protein U9M48_037872 [Paspalum notatum var. saurae]|uniref:Uncharacterized protein n=1 Tax=Paspalum notatum var. saurae TaxID=547442 RepID=A0AAQ3UKT0_PASNO
MVAFRLCSCSSMLTLLERGLEGTLADLREEKPSCYNEEVEATAQLNQQTERIILMCNQVVNCNRRHHAQKASLTKLHYEAVMPAIWVANSPALLKGGKSPLEEQLVAFAHLQLQPSALVPTELTDHPQVIKEPISSASATTATLLDVIRRLRSVYNKIEEIMRLPSSQATPASERLGDATDYPKKELLQLLKPRFIFSPITYILFAKKTPEAVQEYQKQESCRVVKLLGEGRDIAVSVLDTSFRIIYDADCNTKFQQVVSHP